MLSGIPLLRRSGSFAAVVVALLALTAFANAQTAASVNSQKVAPVGTAAASSLASDQVGVQTPTSAEAPAVVASIPHGKQTGDTTDVPPSSTNKPSVVSPAPAGTDKVPAVTIDPASPASNQDAGATKLLGEATPGESTNLPKSLTETIADPSANLNNPSVPPPPPVACSNTIKADVVAFDQPYLFNRLGAARPGGMIYALRGDVQPISGGNLDTGNVQLRQYKRARPIVLRANVGDCLQIKFTNYLAPPSDSNLYIPPQAAPPPPPNGQVNPDLAPATLTAGIHVNGMQMADNIHSDSSNVGGNTNSLVAPGQTTLYNLFATAEGTFLLYSMGAPMRTGQITAGLFGAINVQPKGAEWYRSQVTEADMKAASTGTVPDGVHPKINYDATYPACPGDNPHGYNRTIRCSDTSLPPMPILNMLDANKNIRHTDLTGLITGPKSNGYMFVNGSEPVLRENPAEPNRLEPYREFTIIYHESTAAVQAFPHFYDKKLEDTLLEARDMFAINYGIGGIGSEILANRIFVGPTAHCADCKFEEFFLSSWAVGDPAMIVDVPANVPAPAAATDPRVISPTTDAIIQQAYGDPPGPPIVPEAKPKATKAFYSDDPSNVYHSYMGDHTKFRILHGGTGITHVHHLHAHQWLHSPNDDNSTYMDSQMLNPGAAYTLEIDYNGSGNRNKTVGDSIFHCHFYPHFAAGMWALWRSHDVFEAGTELGGEGRPITGARALPDGEIAKGTPIPALVPIPTNAMAPMPGKIAIAPVCDIGVLDANCTEAAAIAFRAKTLDANNPGYPFFIPGIGGGRAPHPPLDFATDAGQTLDGGLPRHLVVASQQTASGEIENEQHTQWDFTKDLKRLAAFKLPEAGTPTELVAMQFHSVCEHPSFTPLGTAKLFITNGLPQQPGAPFADPATNGYNPTTHTCPSVLAGPTPATLRRYKAAVVQMDVAFNKVGWHFPQQRMLTLWQDVAPTIKGIRPPEPFFFRANSGDVVEYWHTNLVPNYYELDDFQVRTPTDILGQHIHLVKFDVTSSDGSGNGFNYEDGTFSPDEVRDLIKWINQQNQITHGTGLFEFDPATQWANKNVQTVLQPKAPPAVITSGLNDPSHYNDCLQPNNPDKGIWCGAQTTVQRWYADPLLNLSSVPNTPGKDRTIRTVFTHDHFGPSTHQQVGLYAALVVEPKGSRWRETEPSGGFPAGQLMGGRADGGPTSWRANIETANAADSYREFLFEIQDMALAYGPKSKDQSQFVKYPCLGKTTVECQIITQQIEANIANAVQNGTPAPPCPSGTINRGTPPACVPAPWGWTDYPNSINPLFPSNTAPKFFPISIISGNVMGSQLLNYRNELLPNRVIATTGANANQTADGAPGNLSHVFRSIARPESPLVNVQPVGGSKIDSGCVIIGKPWDPNWPCFTFPRALSGGVNAHDPFTPLARVYEGDKVQVRVLPGAHMSPHYFTFNGVNWLFEPGTPNDPTALTQNNSGYRATQPMGISEHWEMLFTTPMATKAAAAASCTAANGTTLVNCKSSDYLYTGNALTSGLQHGMWGLMRAYKDLQPDLVKLPNNAPGGNNPISTSCPAYATGKRTYDVTAITTQLIYNSRPTGTTPTTLKNPNAIIYVMTDDLTHNNLNKMKIEPLVLRAAAGECIEVKLTNAVDPTATVFTSPTNMDAPFGPKLNPPYPPQLANSPPPFSGWPLTPSRAVGLHAQLVSFNVTASDGMNVGSNPVQTAAAVTSGAPKTVTYRWYAGNAPTAANPTATPIEFGAVGLFPSDPLLQHQTGLLGALVIEPKGSSWICDGGVKCDGTTNNGKVPVSYASATVTKADNTTFREFVVIAQDDATITPGGAAAINYRSEPMPFRYTFPPGIASQSQCPTLGIPGLDMNNCPDVWRAFSNKLVQADPQTPIFTANAGQPVRFRLVQPGGSTNGQVFTLHGHVWQEEPYKNNSTEIGDNPLSQWIGSRDSYGSASHYDIVLPKAGGEGLVPGDYLYRTYVGGQITKGLWGIFRVAAQCGPQCPDAVTITSYTKSGTSIKVQGTNTVRPSTGVFAGNVNLCAGDVNTCVPGGPGFLHTQPVNPLDGSWEFNANPSSAPTQLTAISDFLGRGTFTFEAPVVPLAAPARVSPESKNNTTDRFEQKPLGTPKKP